MATKLFPKAETPTHAYATFMAELLSGKTKAKAVVEDRRPGKFDLYWDDSSIIVPGPEQAQTKKG